KIRIAHAHTTFDYSEPLLRKIYILFMRALILFCSTHFLACSEAAGRYLFGKHGIAKTKYAHFPNVIDYDMFMQQSVTDIKKTKVEEGLGNRMVIGHIGRFSKEKNHIFL